MDLSRFAHALKSSPIFPQAYLFYGPKGASKEFKALEFFKTLMCQEATLQESAFLKPCETCFSCKSITQLSSPDIFYLLSSFDAHNFERATRFLIMKPYLKPIQSLVKRESLKLYGFLQHQNQMKKEELAKLEALFHEPFTPSVAEKLLVFSDLAKKIGNSFPIAALRKTRESLSVSPYQLPKKLLLIKDVAHLSEESANALLKTFEEPHENLMIFLITSKPHLLLPTIKSRAIKIKIPKISPIEEGELAQKFEGWQLNSIEPTIEELLTQSPDLWKEEEIERLFLYLRSQLNFFSPLDQEKNRFYKEILEGFLEYNLSPKLVQTSLAILLKLQGF